VKVLGYTMEWTETMNSLSFENRMSLGFMGVIDVYSGIGTPIRDWFLCTATISDQKLPSKPMILNIKSVVDGRLIPNLKVL
jgi:hypothetical protein